MIKFIRTLKILPRWVIVLIDLTILFSSAILGYFLRFNFNLTELSHSNLYEGVLAFSVCGLFSILITNSYKGIIRYTGVEDAARIFYMVGLNLLSICAINLIFYYNNRGNLVPYSVLFIAFLSSFLFLFNYRLLVKYVFTSYKSAILKRTRVLIFGAGQTGIITRHVINSTPRMQVVGFLEDSDHKIGKVIDGAEIFNAKGENVLHNLLDELNIDELIITVKDISLDRKNEIVEACLANQVKVRIIPPVEKWVRGELSFNQIKQVNIEDLLGRDVIKLNNPIVEQDLRGRRILITGAAGSIGSELVRQLVQYSPERVVLIDQSESDLYEIERELQNASQKSRIFVYLADITNRERILSIFQEHKPEIVYHAAAYKHVPMMESNPSEAVSCNILGTKSLADISVEMHVSKFVMISTDKAVNPTNVMGCSKRIAEIYVQALSKNVRQIGSKTAFVTTRFGNVLGSNGSVIPIFKKQIEMGGPISVTHPEITRYFMTIQEACQLVLEAGTMGHGGEIFIFDMGKSVKILDLAKKMISLSGLEPHRDIEIIFTGLREGEKLYEELLNTAENTVPTHHNKILIAKVNEYEYEEINRYIELFNDLVIDRNELKMVALMKELVPEYVSNYSRYEILDRE